MPRNYKAMKEPKLLREAKVCPPEDLPRVEEALAEKGLSMPTRFAVQSSWKPPTPMLAKAAKFVPDLPNAVMEWKLDGWRLFVVKRNGVVTCYTRTGKVMSSLPYINKAFESVNDNSIFDGEIVDLAAAPGQEWNRVQELCGRDAAHVPTDDNPALTYMAFDCLEDGASDLRSCSLRARGARLALMLPKDENVQLIPQMPVSQATYEQMAEEGYEGVIIKKLDDPYMEGKRGFIKVKPKQTVNAIVTGTYEAAAGSKYAGSHVGGITFEVEWSNGKKFNGRAAGMDDKLRKSLYDNPGAANGFCVEIEHGGITKDWTLRFPRFKRILANDVKLVEDVNA